MVDGGGHVCNTEEVVSWLEDPLVVQALDVPEDLMFNIDKTMLACGFLHMSLHITASCSDKYVVVAKDLLCNSNVTFLPITSDDGILVPFVTKMHSL